VGATSVAEAEAFTPAEGDLVRHSFRMARFFESQGLELRAVGANEKGWEGVSRGYHGLYLLEEAAVTEDVLTQIRPTFNAWSLLPNLKVTTAEEVYALMNANRGGLYLPHFDLDLLARCPPESGVKRSEHLYVRGSHTISEALFACNPTVRFDLERIDAIEVPLGPQTMRSIQRVHVGAQLDAQSVAHLRTFPGAVTISAEQYPAWLDEGIAGAQWASLSIHGLTELTVAQARSIGQLRDKTLSMTDLAELSAAAAAALDGTGKLHLPAVRALPPEAMGHLTAQRAQLTLGLQQIDAATMAAVQGGAETRLDLPELTDLPVKTIRKGMAEVTRQLRFGRLSPFGADHLEALVDRDVANARAPRKAGIVFFRFERIDLALFEAADRAVQEKRIRPPNTHLKHRLFGSARQIDPAVMQRLMDERSDGSKPLTFPRLQVLPPETAQILAEHQEVLLLNGLEAVSNETLAILARAETTLSLDGLTHLKPGQAEILGASGVDTLSLKGLQGISIDQLRHFRDFAGELVVDSWLLYSYEGRPWLLNHGASLNTGRIHPDAFAQIPHIRSPRLKLDLRELSAEQAGHIARFPGDHLSLAVPELTPEVAEALAQFPGEQLRLRLRAVPTEAGLLALRSVRGRLGISYDDNMEDPLVDESLLLPLVAAFGGEKLSLGLRLKTVSESLMQAFVDSDCTALGVTAAQLSPEAMAVLAAHPERQLSGTVRDQRLCVNGSPAASVPPNFDNGYCEELMEMEDQDLGL